MFPHELISKMGSSSPEYDAEASMEWMRQHRPLFALVVAAYATFVVKAPRICRQGMPRMKKAIFFWNVFNAFADMALFFALLPEFLESFYGGLYSSICLSGDLYKSARTGKALFAFHISKTVELLDTVFVILDGREASMLHVAHHIVTSISTIYSYQQLGAMARWIAITNLGAHCTLYSYLAAQSYTRKRRSRSARVVTGIQLAQFLICLFVLLKARQFVSAGQNCETGYSWPAILLYTTFLILFLRFHVGRHQERARKTLTKENALRGSPCCVHPSS